jgi:hypothetical protein
VFLILSQFLLQFTSILIFFSYCNFYVCQFVLVFVANLMCVNLCLSFCCNFYVCWLLYQFFLQFLCVLILVSVFVAICECVDLSQFLQFLWVLICLRFLELFVVFWSISLPSGWILSSFATFFGFWRRGVVWVLLGFAILV